jgi:hypothetical protein
MVVSASDRGDKTGGHWGGRGKCELFSLELDVEVLFVCFGFVDVFLDAGTSIKLAVAKGHWAVTRDFLGGRSWFAGSIIGIEILLISGVPFKLLNDLLESSIDRISIAS